MAPGALRSVFDSFIARSGLLTEMSEGPGNATIGRVVGLSTATVDAVEALTTTIANRRRRHGAAWISHCRRPATERGCLPRSGGCSHS
ncbi:hypothetical protein [Streptomyces collinus]|uniref:hypothetical protein n=1 Tax=Streptomyces collinus TaxID=42684 RepID=UPI0037FAA081